MAFISLFLKIVFVLNKKSSLNWMQKVRWELHVKTGIKFFAVQDRTICTTCSEMASMLYLGKRIWFWRGVMKHEQLARFCVRTMWYSWKTVGSNLKWCLYFIREQFFMHCFCCQMDCKVVGAQSREGGCPIVLTAVLCPVLLSAPDSWIYNCVPGKSHSTSNRWKHPSPNSSMALGSHVNQGKGGGSLGALGCRSQLPLSNFRRGVQEQCGVENFPNVFLKAAISEWVKDENVALCFSLPECPHPAPGQRSLLFPAVLCPVGSSSSCRGFHPCPLTWGCVQVKAFFIISEFHKVTVFSMRMSFSFSPPVGCLAIRAFHFTARESLKVTKIHSQTSSCLLLFALCTSQLGSTGRYGEQTWAKPE